MVRIARIRVGELSHQLRRGRPSPSATRWLPPDSELRSFSRGTTSGPGPTPLRLSLASSRCSPTAGHDEHSELGVMAGNLIRSSTPPALTRYLVFPRGWFSRQLDRGSLGFEGSFYIVWGDDATIPQSRYSGSSQSGVGEFTGSERPVADYLLAEVLERQNEEVKQLLLRTSSPQRV